MKQISGIDTPVKGGMAVRKPFDIRAHSPDGYIFTRWLATLPLWTPLLIIAVIGVYPLSSMLNRVSLSMTLWALWRWMPFLLVSGFLSCFDFILDAGNRNLCGALGLGQISTFSPLRAFSWFITQLFRNLAAVILFIVLLALPFEFTISVKLSVCLTG